MSNIHSTDLDRSEKSWNDYPKDDPEQGTDCMKLFYLVVVLLVIVGTAISTLFGRLGFWDHI